MDADARGAGGGHECGSRDGRPVGRRAAELGVDVLIGVGAGGRVIIDAARGPQVHAATDAADALRVLVELVAPGDAVLVKASRAVGLEMVAAGLLARAIPQSRG